MKNSITSTGWQYSTARMLMDYTEQMYIPLCNLYNTYYSDLENVMRLNEWIEDTKNRWDNIKIRQLDNLNNVIMDAGNNIEVKCEVDLQNIDENHVSVEVYSGKVLENRNIGGYSDKTNGESFERWKYIQSKNYSKNRRRLWLYI